MEASSGLQSVSGESIESLRHQILDRRNKLLGASGAVSASYLNDLISEIDAALHRMDHGTFGLCETCHDPIEQDRLAQNPMVRFCLDHMSASELHAHQQDLDLATKIQSKLLPPKDLRLDAWEMHYRYHPIGAVGGDYCELIQQDDGNSLFFAVGDVSGKGIAASLLMTHLSAIFRSLLSLDFGVADVMTRANRLFCDGTASGHYATLVCGRATRDTFEIANAGHCKPLVIRRESTERLECAGLPLGLFCGVQYEICSATLEPGDSLILYSDGITESQDLQGSEFGEARLIESARRHFGKSVEVMTDGILSDVHRFRSPLPPVDDETLLVLRRR